MPANYVLINEQTTNATVASVTFSNIPQTGYTDLKIVVSGRSNAVRDDDYAVIALNGVTTNQSARVIYGTGSANGSVSGTPVSTPICAANNTANTFGNSEVYIPNYTSNTNKAFTQIGVLENNATWGVQNIGAGLWSPGTSVPVTSIVFTSTYGSFVAGSSFSLYGIAAFGTEPTVLPKASGGDIITNDGTYWYHAFLSSGVFTPSSTLTCNALVVAGGGSGGANGGGGGGAGGTIVLSPTSLLAQNYAVVVGAGGPGTAGVGVKGSNTVFGSNTAVGGGGGGAFNQAGLAGGSGGGGGMSAGATVTGGAPTVGQGFAGGTGSSSYSSSTGGGGGGGGAGAVGDNAVNANPHLGKGGVGVSGATYSFINSAGAALGVGQLSGGNYYFAGGGAGGPSGFSVSNYGGLGGGANFNASASANTGGGGGAGQAYGTDTPGNGGSGIVIVRYTMA